MPNGGRSCHRSCSIHSSIHYMVFAWFFHAFHAFEAACLVMSGIGGGLSSSFLWASEGDVRQFFGGWFLDRLGLNPAGVWLFRHRAERRPELPPKLPLCSIHSSIHYMVFEAACLVMSGIGGGLSSSFLWASEGDVRQFFGGWFLDRLGLNPAGVWLFRHRAERRPELPPKLPLQLHPQLHPLHGFCTVFHAFEAACLVMSGLGVGLSSSFLWASEGDVRQFFGGWFLDRLGLNPAGVWLFRHRAERRPELPLQLHPQLHPRHGFCIVFSCF